RPFDQRALDKVRQTLTSGNKASRIVARPKGQPCQETGASSRAAKRVVSFYPGGRRAFSIVKMDANKKRVVELVANRSALRQGEVAIAVAGEDSGISRSTQERLCPQSDVQGQILFHHAAAHRSGILPAVARIEHDHEGSVHGRRRSIWRCSRSSHRRRQM